MIKKSYMRGRTWKPRLTFVNDKTGLAVDVSNYVPQWALKLLPDETSSYIIAPITGTSDTAGHFDAKVPKATTATIPPGTYYAEWKWDVVSGVEDTGGYQYEAVVIPRVIV